jgi:hypothetical protein
MPDNAFKRGYIAGWRSVRDKDEIAAVPLRPASEVETAFRAGIARGVSDAIARTAQEREAESSVDAFLDRALRRRGMWDVQH